MANATTAMMTASMATSPYLSAGGNAGGGMLKQVTNLYYKTMHLHYLITLL